MKEAFRVFAEKSAHAAGTHWAFLLAVATVLVWGITGPYFGYSDTWQLFINTGTTIITFLMVFLIQNTQNRETRVVALKLDELLRGVEGARTGFVNLDDMSDEALEQVQRNLGVFASNMRLSSTTTSRMWNANSNRAANGTDAHPDPIPMDNAHGAGVSGGPPRSGPGRWARSSFLRLWLETDDRRAFSVAVAAGMASARTRRPSGVSLTA